MFRFNVAAILVLGLVLIPVRAALADDALYRDLGGKEKISAFTDDFVDRLLRDERIKGFFEDANIPRLKRLLAEEFCALGGGPVEYSGRSMKETHAGMNIRQANFNALAEDLQDAMESAGVPYATQNRLIALLAPMEREIVTK